MGIVLSSREVKCKQWAEDGAQQSGMEEFCTRADREWPSSNFGLPLKYLGYGSVAEGRANRRSDVDVLVVIPDHLAIKALNFVLFTMDEISERRNIKFEPYILTESQAKLGYHHIDSLFGAYLKGIDKTSPYRSASGVNSVKIESPEMFVDDLAKYFSEKSDRFSKAVPGAFNSYSESKFQRALELPARIVQKFDQAGVDKSAVTAEVDYELLQARNSQYNRILSEIIDGCNGEITEGHLKEYDTWTRYEYSSAAIEAARLSMRAYGIVLEHQAGV